MFVGGNVTAKKKIVREKFDSRRVTMSLSLKKYLPLLITVCTRVTSKFVFKIQCRLEQVCFSNCIMHTQN